MSAVWIVVGTRDSDPEPAWLQPFDSHAEAAAFVQYATAHVSPSINDINWEVLPSRLLSARVALADLESLAD